MEIENNNAMTQGQPDVTADAAVVDNAELLDNEGQADQIEGQDDADNADVGDSEGGDKFPKKAVNALNRKNKQIHALRAKMRELEAHIAKASQGSQQNQVVAPREEDFDTYGEFLKAEMRHALKQEIGGMNQQQQQNQLHQQQASIRAQQDAIIEQNVRELVNAHPDVAKTLREHAHVLENMPPHIEQLFYELDDVAAASYALAKEGRLEDLYYMQPQMAIAEMVRAQERGRNYLTKKTSQAPKPVASVTGGGGGSTPLGNQSVDDLMKWYHKS